jgi:hypothetical protein
MKSRSNVDLQDTAVSLNTNFLPSSFDFALDFGAETPPHRETLATSVSDLQATTSEDGSASDSSNAGAGTSAASTFALLDTQTEAGNTGTDFAPASIIDTSPGSGSINVTGAASQETSAGLHIAPPVDSDFTTDALFAPAASAPTPVASINLANLTPVSFGHGLETAVGFNGAETAMAHPAAFASLDVSTPAVGAAGLAYLENSTSGLPVTNSSVGSGGATASQVQQALDESGLSVNGSGIKVGVLSDSFNDLGGAATDEADGALPSASNIQILKDLGSGGSDEGRAMMEIIHDIAPGASLAFYTAFDSEQDFANGIIALANAGAKVIVDDVGYFDEPFFQNGVVAEAIQTVEAEGVTYVTAAGNEGSNGYQAAWSTTSGTFDGHALTNAMNFGGNLTQTVTINTEGTGDSVPLVLEWNQAYGAVSSSTADLELLVFHNGSLVGTATNAGDGESTNPWVEYDFSASGTYQVAIVNMSAASTDSGLIIKEITEGDGLPATISGANSGTVVGHPLTPGAITAGAVSAADTPAFGFSPTSESFSSSGAGAELLFANNGTALSSPDVLSPVAVSGVDDIATSVSGNLSDFYGTSAASASLAGVAALILSADPNLTPAQVETVMEQTALSMGNSAIAGAGLVQVNAAVTEALSFVTTVIQTDGTTALAKVISNYFLDNTGTGTGPELTQNGAAVSAGEFGTWKPIGAVQVAGGGYDVAWYDPTSGQYTIWSVSSTGAYQSNLVGAVAGNNVSLENFESLFNQDLNGDGHIGPPPPTVIHDNGTTSLVVSGSNYFMDADGASGLGPELTQNSAAVTVGEFGTWTPISAVQVAGGYDVAWHDSTSGQFTIWSVSSSGAYQSNLLGAVSGNNTSLENFETLFNQDLNNDGTIGIPLGAHTAASAVIANKSDPAAGTPPDNFHFSDHLTRPMSSSSGGDYNSAASTSWNDAFEFVFGPNAGTSFAGATGTTPIHYLAAADNHAAWAAGHEDAFGNPAAPNAAHLWAHHGFHFL